MKLLLALLLCADVQVADMFGDLMVLQQGIKVPVWGTADPGEKVTVTFDNQTASVKTGRDGRWEVRIGPFDPVAAVPMTVQGKNKVVFARVFVGEVWICSGQSNMQWPLAATDGAEEELRTLVNNRLFLYTVKRRVAGQPVHTAQGRWVRASKQTCKEFSAVAYYFGKKLREELAIPVGLIHASWGGTPAEAWTRRRALDRHEQTKPILRRWDQALADYNRNVDKWRLDVERWKKEGKKGRRPAMPLGPNHPHRPSGPFNGMIEPVIPYAMRGVIWYQGESNATRANQYRTLFPAMIRDWRAAWGQGEFAFYYVQLANWRAIKPEPTDSAWAELRESQLYALREPNTGMAVTIDIGDAKDIHPRNKKDVGGRLARIALARLYGKEVVDSGPLFDGHQIEKGRIRIRFLHATGLTTRNEDPLRGFAICGKDFKWRWAHAVIDNETVVASHPQIATPVAVRYAWADNPVCNLVNGAGLPASPFRTDLLKGLTEDRR
jgi:sialate O-acetylesterase